MKTFSHSYAYSPYMESALCHFERSYAWIVRRLLSWLFARLIMGGISKAKSALVIVIIFVSSIAGTVLYYNGLLANKNSQITSLNNQINAQNTEISNLTGKIATYTAYANLVTNLNIQVTYTDDFWMAETLGSLDYVQFPALFIVGSVTNDGDRVAYNAGLRVVGYSANGTLEVNTTVPIVSDGDTIRFGTDNATNANASYWNGINHNNGLMQFGSLYSGQTAPVKLSVLYEGEKVINYTVTPFWTQYP